MTTFTYWHVLITLALNFHLFPGFLCLVDITYHVEEERNTGTYIGDIAADFLLLNTSPYQGSLQTTFNQLQQRKFGSNQLFNVTTSGKLHTARILDAEQLCSPKKDCYTIVKVAVRQADMFMRILKVKVIIEDVNDHHPEFPERVENIVYYETDGIGTIKTLPHAIDRDVGVVNSKISYQLRNKPDLPFTLSARKTITGSSELGIILARKLDREVKDSYNLQVIAKDGGYPSKQGVLDVHISVIDLNDNSPVFNKDIYNISVRNTHQRNRPIAMVSAKDLDSGENGHVINLVSKAVDIEIPVEINNVQGLTSMAWISCSIINQVTQIFCMSTCMTKYVVGYQYIACRRFQQDCFLYPDAVFPDCTFLVTISILGDIFIYSYVSVYSSSDIKATVILLILGGLAIRPCFTTS
ncbi:protocadherin-11 X-linked-like [Octopus bimaculoides]|uniref:protocadherin-11 X-linked-like n=1 Tax=Octopus bimaculoides TaxID=37653 RepID=UPI0022E78E2E|nr:protocadherin-11 X-linked-like [Octopus bimaculoides]